MQGSIKERIRKRGRDAQGRMRTDLKVYDVRYRYIDPITGRVKQIQKRGFLRRSDAEAFLLKINAEQADGIYLAPETVLMNDYLADWLENYAKPRVRASTYEGYERIVKKHLSPALGKFEIKKVTPTLIDRLYANLLRHGRQDGKGGLSAKTVLYTHRVLSEALEHAVKKNLIARNPAKNLTNVPKPKKFRSSIYTVEELLHLLEVIRDTPYELAVALAGLCGLRRGECLALRPEDVDFERHVLHIRRQLIEVNRELQFTEPKSMESIRTIGAPLEVFEIIQRRMQAIQRHKEMLQAEYQEHELLLCGNNGMPFRPRNFTANFKAILVKNRLKDIRFHDLRHTCASLMLTSGVALKTASEILGHSSIAITADLYTHVMEDTKLAAARQIGECVFGTEQDK